jgi:hypothetical protein
MKALLALALFVQIVFAAVVGVVVTAKDTQNAQLLNTSRTLSQENSNLSLRTYDLIAITNQNSMSEAATKFAVALCAQDAQGALDSLNPEVAQAVADQANFYGITSLELAAEFITLPDGTRCTNVIYSGGFIDDSGRYAAIFVLVYTDGDKTWSQFWVITVTESGVANVQ